MKKNKEKNSSGIWILGAAIAAAAYMFMRKPSAPEELPIPITPPPPIKQPTAKPNIPIAPPPIPKNTGGVPPYMPSQPPVKVAAPSVVQPTDKPSIPIVGPKITKMPTPVQQPIPQNTGVVSPYVWAQIKSGPLYKVEPKILGF